MNENEIKKGLDNIEPRPGAQERMYANILKKAAEQREAPAEDIAAVRAAAKRHSLRCQRWGLLAACFAVIIALGVALPRLMNRTETVEPPLLVGSPFEDVDGPEGFEKLGFTIDAPESAENLYYCIYDGEIARVDFTLNGHEYTYEAAKLDGNFSLAEGDAVSSTALNAEYDAALDRLAPDTWRAHWSYDGISYYLTNFDGAAEADITDVADTLMEDN